MSRWLRWLIPLAAVPVLALLAFGFRTDPRALPTVLVGRPAAAFSLTTFAGEPVSLDGLRGKVAVVNFWASWCYPACYEEAPALLKAWERYRERGVLVLGVDIQDKEEPARRFIAQFGLTFPNAPDPSGRVSIDYGVYGVPETFFVDRAGRIRAKHVGAVTEEILTREIEALLREPAS